MTPGEHNENADLLILACSRRDGGRCIAGIDVHTGTWVRPIADKKEPALTLPALNVQTWPELGEIWSVPIGEQVSTPFQPENHLLGAGRWRLVATPDESTLPDRLANICEGGPELFGTSTRTIGTDFCRENPRSSSLAVIEPSKIDWVVGTGYYGKQKVQARFWLAGDVYKLDVTDPNWEARFWSFDCGEHPREAPLLGDERRVFFTVSLGEPFEKKDVCYKLVAAVIAC